MALRFPIALDADQRVGLEYRIIGLPASVWIDANGTSVDRVAGAMAPDVLKEKAARTLAAPDSEAAQVHSLRELASLNDRQRAVAMLDGQPLVSGGDVELRADLLLALEQLVTRLVLDPMRVTDALRSSNDASSCAAISSTSSYWWIVRSRRDSSPMLRASKPISSGVTERSGGPAVLERVLHDHGISIDDLRNLFQGGAVAQQYSEGRGLSADTVGPPEEAIRARLDAERVRRGVQVVDGPCSCHKRTVSQLTDAERRNPSYLPGDG